MGVLSSLSQSRFLRMSEAVVSSLMAASEPEDAKDLLADFIGQAPFKSTAELEAVCTRLIKGTVAKAAPALTARPS